MSEKPLRVSEVSRILGVCDRTTRRLIAARLLKAHWIGSRWRVFQPDIEEYLARHSNRKAVV